MLRRSGLFLTLLEQLGPEGEAVMLDSNGCSDSDGSVETTGSEDNGKSLEGVLSLISSKSLGGDLSIGVVCEVDTRSDDG